jgi:Zn-finger in ubiquitin-hydrolases and other protein
MTCGHVGCCDSSKNKHATKHFHFAKHPIMKSIEPGESWGWCYIDEVELDFAWVVQLYGHAGTELMVLVLARFEHDLYRDMLDYFDPVASGVFRWRRSVVDS